MFKRLILLSTLLLFSLSTEVFGQIISRSLFHSGGIRKYDLHLPPSWQPGDALPLVLDLHYLGGDARDEDSLTNMNAIADSAGFILCHPWGQGTNWNAGFHSPYTVGAHDVDFIRTVIDTIANEYGLDRLHIYAVGMGQGGFMAQRLACELSDEIAAIASVSGSIADSTAFYCQPVRPVPVMIIHGRADTVIPYSGSPGLWPGIDTLVSFWLEKNGCPGATPTTTALPDLVNEGSSINSHRYACNTDSEVLLYEILNGGFAWPGAANGLPNTGIINQDINAGLEIWKFFSQWTLPALLDAPSPESAQAYQVNYGPNPLQNQLKLTFPKGKKPFNINIRNLHGHLFHSETVLSGKQSLEIDCSKWLSGMYILEFESEYGRVCKRLLKL
ncbi:MAG TPA: T9SS type A sorting domain-containing protein [Bacteroidetes bacterium]|nr:T9SS type A sorting domain-containing protein [Bacteroidota bacterium]